MLNCYRNGYRHSRKLQEEAGTCAEAQSEASQLDCFQKASILKQEGPQEEVKCLPDGQPMDYWRD